MFVKVWNADLVLEKIRMMCGNEPLNSHYISENHSDLYAAGCRLFGSWKNTVEAAGLDYAAIRKYKKWESDHVIQEIRNRFERNEPISCRFVQLGCRNLYMAAVHRFGGWNHAVSAAGVDYESVRMRRRLTVDEVKEEIINLFESGEDLSYTNMRKNHLYLLTCGLRKLGGGSWQNARLQCGIYKNFRKGRRVPEGYLEPELFPVDRGGM